MNRIKISVGFRPECEEQRVGADSAKSRTASPKIQSIHLERLAVVYIRQSSAQQVVNNRESRERQHALADHAVSLGGSVNASS
jgi:hypothetical protein